jgi:hypothetical protein
MPSTVHFPQPLAADASSTKCQPTNGSDAPEMAQDQDPILYEHERQSAKDLRAYEHNRQRLRNAADFLKMKTRKGQGWATNKLGEFYVPKSRIGVSSTWEKAKLLKEGEDVDLLDEVRVTPEMEVFGKGDPGTLSGQAVVSKQEVKLLDLIAVAGKKPSKTKGNVPLSYCSHQLLKLSLMYCSGGLRGRASHTFRYHFGRFPFKGHRRRRTLGIHSRKRLR